MHKLISIRTTSQGLYELTSEVEQLIPQTKIRDGLCTLFVRHTSCSLIIQENADPGAKRDMENWINRLVPENDALYTHTAEGPDDMPAHLKNILIQTSLSIPIIKGRLVLGTWQGIYLWEHRHHSHQRQVVVSLMADIPDHDPDTV